MSNLTDLLPAGGGGKGADFVASGALSNGSTVVLKADGTVEVVTSSSVAESIPAGSESVFNNASTDTTGISFDPNDANKFVVTYKDGATRKAAIGVISGTTISFGSGYTYHNTSGQENDAVAFDLNGTGKFVATYYGDSGYGTAIVGTVSGTSISFGSKYIFNSGSSYSTSVVADPNNANKFIISYGNSTGIDQGATVVATVSGASITFGTEFIFQTGGVSSIRTSFDESISDSFIIIYNYSGDVWATSGSISGATITFGTPITVTTSNDNEYRVSLSTGKAVVVRRDKSNSHYGTYNIISVSGTSTTLETTEVFQSSYSTRPDVAFVPGFADKFVISFRDNSSSNRCAVYPCTLNGTTVTLGTKVWVGTNIWYYNLIGFNPNTSGQFVVVYRDGSNSDYGKAIVCQANVTTTNLTSDNFLGISDAAVSDTATGTITLKGGISTNQSGLTIGSDYYVQDDGTLSTTVSSVKAGRALSATTLKLTGE